MHSSIKTRKLESGTVFIATVVDRPHNILVRKVFGNENQAIVYVNETKRNLARRHPQIKAMPGNRYQLLRAKLAEA